MSKFPQLREIRARLETAQAVNVLGLGDSLTYGWEASYSYFDLFVGKLRATWPQAAISGKNAGICGDTAWGGEQRVLALLDDQPHLVFVQFAINDMGCDVNVDSFRDHIASIVRKVIRAGGVPVLITSGPLTYDDQKRAIAPYYEAIHGVGEGYGVAVADLARYWETNAPPTARLYYEDGVHPTDAGYQLMAKGLFSILFD